MVKLVELPVQPAAEGVTVIVAVIGALVVLMAVKAAILPVPDAASPIAVLLLVQLYTVPATAPVKFIAAVVDPLHKDWFATAFTVGVGFTVMVKLVGVPLQLTPPLVYVDVTVIVAVIGTFVVFVAIKAGILPVPAPARPIAVLLFVQVNTVPATGPLITMVFIVTPLQAVWLAIAFTDGVGLTVIVKLIVGPVQVTPPDVNTGVTVMVATTGALVILVAVKLGILPVPVAARPILTLLLVQL